MGGRGEFGKRGRGGRVPAVPADDDRRPRGVAQHAGQRVEACGARRGIGQRKHRRDGGGSHADQDVLGQAHHDGSGAPGGSQSHGPCHHVAGLVLVIEHKHGLGGGGEPALQAELLEGVASAVGQRDQPDEEHHRGGVLPCGVDRDHGVGGAGAAGDHGDARGFAEPALGQGHEAGTALVAGDHRVDRGVVQAVEHVEVAFTRHRIDAGHAVGFEGFDDEVAG